MREKHIRNAIDKIGGAWQQLQVAKRELFDADIELHARIGRILNELEEIHEILNDPAQTPVQEHTTAGG